MALPANMAHNVILTHPQTWNTGPLLSDSCGYIALSHAPSDPRIIIAFRGTYSIENALLDLSAYPQSYVPYTKEGDGDEDGDRKPRCANCTVHSGFMTSWENTRSVLLDHVSEARRQYPDYKLVLAGHSLGGAVATLAGLEMLLRGWGPQVTTFGEPRVGNDAFVRFLDETFNLTDSGRRLDEQDMMFRRVTHVDDPVPLLPLDEWGYKMHAGEIFISKSGLPPSASDVRICEGGEDPTCIAGSDEQEALHEQQEPIEFDSSRSKRGHPAAQVVLGSANSGGDQPLVGTTWNLIPARYRLWQLLFAHRDYFWRLGLFMPSGKPEQDSSMVDDDVSGIAEAPEGPEAPKAPKAPKLTKVPEAPKVPDAPETPI